MILQTGQEINELDQSGFLTQGPTIFTGNIGGSKYIVQVRLVGTTKMIILNVSCLINIFRLKLVWTGPVNDQLLTCNRLFKNWVFSLVLPSAYYLQTCSIYFYFQVSPNSVRLLTGCELLQQLPIEFGSPVAQASCADPHIVIITQVTEMTKHLESQVSAT